MNWQIIYDQFQQTINKPIIIHLISRFNQPRFCTCPKVHMNWQIRSISNINKQITIHCINRFNHATCLDLSQASIFKHFLLLNECWSSRVSLVYDDSSQRSVLHIVNWKWRLILVDSVSSDRVTNNYMIAEIFEYQSY